MLAHRWHSLRYFFSLKNKIRNSIKEQSSANGISVSVATAASARGAIGPEFHPRMAVIG